MFSSNFNNRILYEALKQIKSRDGDMLKKDFLVVVTGSDTGRYISINFVKKCLKSDKTVTLALSRGAEDLSSKEEWMQATGFCGIITESTRVNTLDLVDNHRQIVVTSLTTNTAAKLAAGISDTLTSNLILKGLMKGVSVTACHECCDPDELPFLTKEGNPGYEAIYHMLRENMEKLKKMGIKFISKSDLEGIIGDSAPEKRPAPDEPSQLQHTTIGKKLVSTDDIRTLSSNQNVHLPKGAIITPLARDIAKEKKITFIYE